MFESAPKVGPLMLMMLLLLVLSPAVDSRWTRRPRRTTTPRSTTEKGNRHHHWPPMVAPPATGSGAVTGTVPGSVLGPVPGPVHGPIQAPVQPPIQSPVQPLVQTPIPAPQVLWKPMPRLIDSFDRRSADGEYEFRFQLDNGNTRYERAYWLPVGKDLVLAKKGYYSVPLPNDQFSTIFYTADNRGYHVDKETLTGERPLLPRSLEVPGVGSKMESVKGTKRNSISDPERNEQDVENVEDVVDGAVDTSVAGTERVPNAVSQVETETETETEPSTLANDILATETADEDDDDDEDEDKDDDDSTAPAPDDVDDEGNSN